VQVLVLISRIIILIAGGLQAIAAVVKVADESGFSFSELWDNLPDEYK
jgi:hypothetical protein